MQKMYFTTYDGENLPYLKLSNNNKKKVIILHNAFEHMYRYEGFANYLFSKNYDVYILEYRGHGELLNENIADFGNKGLSGVINDILLFIKNEFSSVDMKNLTIISQGFGSIISLYILETLPLSNAILLSTTLEKRFSIFLGKLITKIEMKLKMKASILPKIIKLNKEAKWFNNDSNECDKVIEDEMVAKKGSPIYYHSMLSLIKYVKKNIKNIYKNCNILMIFGTKDPLCIETKLKKYMQKINDGNKKIKFLKIKNARHDLLNEVNKKEIYLEIIKYLDSV